MLTCSSDFFLLVKKVLIVIYLKVKWCHVNSQSGDALYAILYFCIAEKPVMSLNMGHFGFIHLGNHRASCISSDLGNCGTFHLYKLSAFFSLFFLLELL